MKKIFCLSVLIFNFLLLSAQHPLFSFAVISDMHISPQNVQNADDLKSVIADINNQRNIAFVFVTGDITDKGDLSSLMEAKKMLGKLNVPFYPLAGNHDTKNTDDFGINFKKVFGADKFRHSFNGFFFLGLSSGQYLQQSEGHFSAQDIVWLQRTLKNIGSKKPVFFVTHHPLKTGDTDNWFEITDILRQYNTQAALSGHYHKDFVLNYDGIIGIINSSTQRSEDSLAHYTIYQMADSLYVFDKPIGNDAQKRYALPIEQKFYPNTDTKNFPRPNFDINKNYKNVKTVWLKRLNTDTYAAPTVKNGLMYFGSETGNFFCFDTKKGKQKWVFRSMDKVVGRAAAVDDKVIFGSTDRNVYCLDANTGKLIWKYQYKNPIFADANISENFVFFENKNNDYFAINIADGTLCEDCKTAEITAAKQILPEKITFLQKNDSDLAGKYFVEDNFIIFLSEKGVISFVDYDGNVLAKQKIGNNYFNRPVKVAEREYVFTTISGYVGKIIF